MKKCVLKQWGFQKIQGDLRLMRQLLNGPWPAEEFLVAQPGQVIQQGDANDVLQAGE